MTFEHLLPTPVFDASRKIVNPGSLHPDEDERPAGSKPSRTHCLGVYLA